LEEGATGMGLAATTRIRRIEEEGEIEVEALVTYIAEAVVDNPELVNVKEVEGECITIYELTVGEEDYGRIIGKDGKMINAIRTVLVGASIKEGKRASLQLIRNS
jgi:predicted RNA-binding protein YlqC (UPF0109 family)